MQFTDNQAAGPSLTLDFPKAVERYRGYKGTTGLRGIVAAIGVPEAMVDVLTAALDDHAAEQERRVSLVDGGAGPAACNAAEENLQLVRVTPGTDTEEVRSYAARYDQAFADRSRSYGNAAELRSCEQRLTALEEYFPELLTFSVGESRPLHSRLSLPAATLTACHRIGLDPYRTAWRDFGKLPDREDPNKPRQFRRMPERIEADAAVSSLYFEADSPVTLMAAAGDEKLATFTMTAYTGGKMMPRGFSIPVIVDLASASALNETVPVFKNHDPNEIVGHGQLIVKPTGIFVTDGVVSGGGAAADEVRLSAKKKFPWRPSIGGNPGRMEFVAAGKTVRVNGRTHSGPVNVAYDTVVHEVSFVPLAGDNAASAQIAANLGGVAALGTGPLSPAQRIELDTLRAAARQGQAAPMIEALRSSNDGNQTVLGHLRRVAIAGGLNPAGPRQVIEAATSGLHGFNAFGPLVTAPIIAGFHAGSDSTLGWTRRVPLPDYRISEIATVNQAVRLSQVARGETAAHIQYAMSSPAGWKLAKFGVQFEIDEQDLIDGLRMAPLQVSLEEIGKSFSRLIPDMVLSYLLSNPTLEDGTVLFHADRGNIGTGGGSALQLSALATGVGAIGNQTLPVERGGVAHINPVAKYLITPPGLNITARGLAVDVNVGDETDLVVRSESRMGTAGVIDPLADDILAGTATNWLLAAPHEQAPSIFVGTLDGATQPTIRSGELKRGGWGMWFDISFSVGVIAVDGRGLYWATGA